jgi:hypothetical protein
MSFFMPGRTLIVLHGGCNFVTFDWLGPYSESPADIGRVGTVDIRSETDEASSVFRKARIYVN